MDSSFHKHNDMNKDNDINNDKNNLNTNHNPIQDVDNDDIGIDENMDLDDLLRDIGHSD